MPCLLIASGRLGVGAVHAEFLQLFRLFRQLLANSLQLGLIVITELGAFGSAVVRAGRVNLFPVLGVDPGHARALKVVFELVHLAPLNDRLVPLTIDTARFDHLSNRPLL